MHFINLLRNSLLERGIYICSGYLLRNTLSKRGKYVYSINTYIQIVLYCICGQTLLHLRFVTFVTSYYTCVFYRL